MSTADGLAIVFFIIIAFFFLLYILVNYQTPVSYRSALKNIATTTLIYCAVAVAFNLVQFGLAFENWRWAMLVGIAIATLLRLVVDGLALYNRKPSESL